MSELKIDAKLLNDINHVLSNKVLMEFCKNEALEKVASEIREKTGGGTTAKAVEILMIRNKNIENRVVQYTQAGAVACLMMRRGELK